MSARPIDLVRSKVSGIEKIPGGFKCLCPCHEDHTPSLHVTENAHGHVLVYCQACKDAAPAARIAEALGLKIQDFFASNGSGPRKDDNVYYDYRDARGKLLYQSVRWWNKKKNRKSFFYRRPDPNDPNPESPKVWINSLHTVPSDRSSPLAVRLVPYRLKQLKAGIRAGKTIYIVEGEKDVHAVESQGAVATCNAMGAGQWLPEFGKLFQGADVIIVADKQGKDTTDEGIRHAMSVAESVKPFAKSVRTVQAKNGKDSHDHLAAGNTLADFVPYIPGALRVETFDDSFEPVSPTFLWDPYLPLRKCVLLDADGGTGKTAIMCGIAAAFSNGVTPVSAEPCEPIKTLYLHKNEDQSEELQTVYKACHGKTGYISFYSNLEFVFDAKGCAELRATIETGGFKLVVIDALMYFLSNLVKDTSDLLEVLPVMQRLQAVAEDMDVTILDIRHTAKMKKDKDASELGLGSVQFRNSHRGQLVMRKHPEEKGLIIITDEKGSLLVPKGDPFGFRRIGNEIQFIKDVDNPFEYQVDVGRGRPPASVDRACEALRGALRDGSRPIAEVIDEVMRICAVSRATVFRAKKKLQVAEQHGLWEMDPFASETVRDETPWYAK